MFRKILFIFLLLTFSLGFFSTFQYYCYHHRPIILVEGMPFKIEPGSSVRKILRELSQSNQVSLFSRKWFEWFIRWEVDTGKMKAGEYIFKKGMAGAEIIQQVTKGKAALHSLTLIEGKTFKESLQAIQKHPAIKVTLDPNNPQKILESLKIEHPYLEGLFFPETYYFPKGTTDRDFLLRAHRLMLKKLQIAWSARAPNLALDSSYQILILASILEKESALIAEWPIMSQVFHNRLKRKMRLQADPTVIYGLGATFSGKLTREALRSQNPFNTYTVLGLPPSPIANPSFGAILAACKPVSGDYLYFVAKGDGTHHFSSTLEEHDAMVKKYQLR